MKEKVQRFGRALSGMVMPNIGAFIAWGLIAALFISTGRFPNEDLARLVSPMTTYLLPLLIAYTGGTAVHGQRGGVIGAITTMGVIVGSTIPMFIGAMIMGPLSAWILKKFDRLIENKVKAGFEMLINNFSIGIIGAILAGAAMFGVAPLVTSLNSIMEVGVGFFVSHGLLPLASIFIEPAKVLFLNNAINHGILSPLGIQQVEETGKSIFFLLEANPGPGLGILLAYCIAGKGSAKKSAPAATIIHFLGGIHEIYFPYILMNPLLLLAIVAGGASGIFVFSMFDVGLTAPASPGSIFAILMMCEQNSYLGLILGVVAATAVTFFIAAAILKLAGKDTSLEEATAQKDSMKKASKGIADTGNSDSNNTENKNMENKDKAAGNTRNEKTAKGNAGTDKISKIAFACDAGMGSSAMGATVLKKKIAAAGITGIEVIHTPVSSIPKDVQIVVTHQELGERAARSNPNARRILITNFLAAPEYDRLVEELKNN